MAFELCWENKVDSFLMDLHPNSAMKKHKLDQGALFSVNGSSMSVGESSGSVDLCKSPTSVSLNSNNPNGSGTDISCQDDDDENIIDDEDFIDDDDALEEPDDDSDFYYDDDIYEDNYSSMQVQFDNVDLPPGVEASLPWLKDIASSKCVAVARVPTESSSKGKVDESKDEVIQKFFQFKQFGTVDAFPDHYYDKEAFSQRPKNWAKKIQEEWKILEENLPEKIFVRVCETRMELMRAVIIGPQGTPYHDGLFFFDCIFPPSYPDVPPLVHYNSGGLRLNPNLYDCGRVCLSLLGTWHGKNTENWVPEESTMLQVLVSIQALILNENPFFNEPGYKSAYRGTEGQRRSKEYNDNTFILSLKTMMYTLRKPPKHFEDFVAGHFRISAYEILTACKSYAEGAPVGSDIRKLAQSSSSGSGSGSGSGSNGSGSGSSSSSISTEKQEEFQSAVSRMMNTLIAFFTKNGSTDCEEFRSLETYNLTAVATNNLETYNIEM